ELHPVRPVDEEDLRLYVDLGGASIELRQDEGLNAEHRLDVRDDESVRRWVDRDPLTLRTQRLQSRSHLADRDVVDPEGLRDQRLLRLALLQTLDRVHLDDAARQLLCGEPVRPQDRLKGNVPRLIPNGGGHVTLHPRPWDDRAPGELGEARQHIPDVGLLEGHGDPRLLLNGDQGILTGSGNRRYDQPGQGRHDPLCTLHLDCSPGSGRAIRSTSLRATPSSSMTISTSSGEIETILNVPTRSPTRAWIRRSLPSCVRIATDRVGSAWCTTPRSVRSSIRIPSSPSKRRDRNGSRRPAAS